MVSTFTFVLGTFPEFQKEEDTGQPPPYPEAVLVMDVVGMNWHDLNKNWPGINGLSFLIKYLKMDKVFFIHVHFYLFAFDIKPFLLSSVE